MSRLAHRPYRSASVALAALLACSTLTLAYADDGDDRYDDERSHRSHNKPPPPQASGPAYKKGVVAVANPYGAEAGARILERGGNAVDAAVAIAYALNVVEPQSAGIGGGGFMMIHLAGSGRTFVIDTREKAPAGATPDMFVGVPNSSLQGVAVGVPGMVRGTAHAIRKYGKLDLDEVLRPAIKLADEGFAATPRFVASPDCANANSRAKNSPLSAEYFCPGGQAIPAGTVVTNKPLAQTFRLIARHGPDCFYKYMPHKGCDIAKGIVEGQKFNRPQSPNGKGGSMSYADLENYRAVERKPIEGSYRGYPIKAAMPPSSGGLTVIQMLKMLERFPIGDASLGYGFGSVKTINVMADAMRLAFADRSIWMGDSDFVPVPRRGLLHPHYVEQRGNAIEPGARITPNPLPGDPLPFESTGHHGGKRLAVAEPVTGPGETTTHFVAADKWGNVVSYTNTIESGYGIGVFAGYTQDDGSFKNHGFLLNNELTDFNTAPTTNPFTGSTGYNDVQPAKRPRSSMTPAMIFTPNGDPLIAYGSPGGSTIINSVLNVTLNLIDHKMTLQDAINAPRVSITSTGSAIARDNGVQPATGIPQATVDGLVALGYSVGAPVDIGSVQAVLIDPKTGRQYGAADSRREGTVIGLPR
jgi:gamma-glutamyltranspeptidase/glutathione hydrolase